ncbi:amidohydrolase 2 [Rhizopus microsporus var. microsporus]|uniref:Amidohydrolase 2 n=2 Tax=Rhizopus microsporus TaxID=58291 RepID=A0A2G4T216_RHIZD|nr:amidohydrolase 2 [Rhizopus microsporus ATCC 52813]ORE01369.1 amidohydrolase 2 [Rhizopus microsporus var. microsporus]PHZ15070.1 amidohydrolase 2 [Rhizopus microsporus ATCC 52813]
MTIQPVVDAHVHFWHPDEVYIPWISGTEHKDAKEYAQEAKRVGVHYVIYVETNVDSHHGLVEAEWINRYADSLTASATFGGIGGIVAFAPVHQGRHVSSYLRTLIRLVGTKLKGVRYLIQDSSGDPKRVCHPDFVQGVQILGQHNLSFDLTINCNDCPEQFPPLKELVGQCPLVQFVLDHMAKPPCDSQPGEAAFEFWKSEMEALARYENVCCKLSGLLTELKKEHKRSKAAMTKQLTPFIQVARDCFGPDRLMFGSDWPMCTLAASWQEWFEVLSDIVDHWTNEDKQKLFVTNAVRIYRLQSPTV